MCVCTCVRVYVYVLSSDCRASPTQRYGEAQGTPVQQRHPVKEGSGKVGWGTRGQLPEGLA